MRQADGSDLLGANDPRSASIGIIYVAPGDDRPSVLEAILMQDKLGRKQVAVVLPENSRAFQRPVDFDGLKNLRRGLKTEIIFVAPGTPGPVQGPADFARQRRFTVYTSLDNYKSALRAEQPDESNGNGKKGLPLFSRRAKLVPNANAPVPLESFDEPASPPPQPFVAPVIPLSAPALGAAMPLDDDTVIVPDEPAPAEPSGVADDISTLDTDELAHDGRVQPSPAAQQGAGPYVEPVVPVPEDEEVEPVRPRSKSGPIPIPLPLSQTGAKTKPLAPDARGANGAAAPARSGNTGKQAAIGAAAVGAGAAAAFAATRTPATGGGQPPIRGNASGSGGGGGGGGRPRRSTRRLLAILLVLLTLLLLAGIAFASPPGQNLIGHITGTTVTATVTITPDHPIVSESFVVTAVTGTPNPAALQVKARTISYTSPSQSASAGATGSIPGARASGTLEFLNLSTGSIFVSGGTLTGASGVPVSFSSISVPPSGTFTTGTAVNVGTSGNIGAFDINGFCCGSRFIFVKNTTAFTGGQNPLPNSIITQNDINSASNNLISKIKPSAQSALQQQVQANEQVVNGSLKCTTNVTANHRVGDQAKSVTVTGTATCSEEVFDQKGALTLASNALKADVAKKPQYAGYALVGNVVTGITSETVIDTKGTVSLVILAQGVWVYQFTDTILTGIKNKIAKESQSKAQADLNKTPGVMSATISISSGTTMPDAADITIKVVQIPGLTGSPTPTPTTPPGGTTPTPPITPTTGLGQGATATPTSNLGGS